MIRAMTPQERWELSRHLDYEALCDGIREGERPAPQWIHDAIIESIERSKREVVWLVPVTDRRVR
jgi:hypothetical protein